MSNKYCWKEFVELVRVLATFLNIFKQASEIYDFNNK